MPTRKKAYSTVPRSEPRAFIAGNAILIDLDLILKGRELLAIPERAKTTSISVG